MTTLSNKATITGAYDDVNAISWSSLDTYYDSQVASLNIGYVGNVASDGVTNDGKLDLSGTLSEPLTAGQFVRIYDGTTALGVAELTGSGGWNLTTPAHYLTNGLHVFTARVEDSAGSQSAPSTAYNINVDRLTPLCQDITLDKSHLKNGESTLVTIKFSEKVTGLDLGDFRGAVGAVLTDLKTGDGITWTATLTADTSTQVLNGHFDLGMYLYGDIAGNLAQIPSQSVLFSVEGLSGTNSVGNKTATITGAYDDFNSLTADSEVFLTSGPYKNQYVFDLGHTGNVQSGGITNDRALDLSGTLSEKLGTGQLVRVYDGVNALGVATLDGDLGWKLTAPYLGEGQHALTARVEDAAGNQGASINVYNINLDTTQPGIQSLTLGNYNLKNDESTLMTVKFTEKVFGLDLQDFYGIGPQAGSALSDLKTNDGITWTATLTADSLTNHYTGSIHMGLYGYADLAGNVANGFGGPTYSVGNLGSLPANTATAGADVLKITADSGAIDAGAGIDTVVYAGSRGNYTITKTNTGFNVTDSEGVTNALVNVERLEFSDVKIAIDTSGEGGMAYRLYQAAFNRTPDQAGLGYQINALDTGLSLTQVAANFIASPEFEATYGSLDNAAFVTQLYQNVLHRDPDADGFAYHVNNLATGANARENVLAGFSESPENQAALIGTIEQGMVYA